MRITATKILFISALIFGSFVSDTFAQRNSLANIRWELVNAYGEIARNPNAFFEIVGGRFTGNTACNRMFGSVTVRRNTIDFSRIGSTKRMCKMLPGSIPESTFIKGMNDATRFSRNGDNLTLIDRRGRTILRFRVSRPIDPGIGNGPLRLEDRKWMLESIAGRMTFAPITGVFVNFDANRHSAGGNGGCNVFGGTYTSRGSTISIKELISTMRACEEDGKMETEREFLDGLRRADRFEIKDTRLHLYRAGRLLLTLRGENK